MNTYITKSLVFNDLDVANIIANGSDIFTIGLGLDIEPIICDTIYVEGDFNRHDLITVQLGSLSNGLEPEGIDCYSHFEVEVQIFENDETDLQVKDRNFKLENLSMELQKRIHDVAEKMRVDKMKY